MIFRIKFSDSVTAVLRAPDEESARKFGREWRLERWKSGDGWTEDDIYLGDGEVPALTKIVHVVTRGPVEILGQGYGEI